MAQPLKVGAGGATITPPMGFRMGGYGNRDHGAEGRHDQLNSHALFLDDGSTQVIVISSDILGLRAPQVARVRELVEAATGVPGGNVFLACTHTHGGPLMYSDFEQFGSEHEAYLETLYHFMAGAALQAINEAIPVRYGHARRDVTVGANRREHQPDGTTKIGVDVQAPIAPWTDVVCFDRLEGGTLALLYQHAVHGTCLQGDNYLFTADTMGYAMRLIERQLGSSTALFLNGCAGNINPYPRGTFALAERHGTRLGAAVLQAVTEIAEYREEGRLSCVLHAFELPLEDPPTLDEAEREFGEIEPEYVKLEGAHHKNWHVSRRYFTAKALLEAVRNGDAASGLPIEIQVIALDDIALVSLPGEIFVETGFAICDASPFDVTLPVGYANGSIGYVPTMEEIPFGGYEVNEARARYQGRRIRDDADRALTRGALAALEKAAAAAAD